jgi:hypothetical protein
MINFYERALSCAVEWQSTTAHSAPPPIRLTWGYVRARIGIYLQKRRVRCVRCGLLGGERLCTLLKAAAVVEAARRDPACYGDLLAEMDRTGRIDPAYRTLVAHPGIFPGC